jgi:hypothetical protein
MAVESNPRAYLKCLVFKEIVGLSRARFLCGDFVEYLRNSPLRADLVVASGVLYHMSNPVELLHLISRITDCVFIWTHYFDEAAIVGKPDLRRKLNGAHEANHEGFRHKLYRYDYLSSFGRKRFIGGPAPSAFWMEKQAIIDCLRSLQFRSIATNFDEPNHQDGPALALVARR